MQLGVPFAWGNYRVAVAVATLLAGILGNKVNTNGNVARVRLLMHRPYVAFAGNDFE